MPRCVSTPSLCMDLLASYPNILSLYSNLALDNAAQNVYGVPGLVDVSPKAGWSFFTSLNSLHIDARPSDAVIPHLSRRSAVDDVLRSETWNLETLPQAGVVVA
jgi:hypothetical protein